MQQVTTSPTRQTMTDKRPVRTTGSATDPKRYAEQRVISHLPSTVTLRRAQSPTRRPPSSAQTLRVRDASTNYLQKASTPASDSRFFHASEAATAARTPPVSKPSFFTANSFSNTSRPPASTPELRRAGSAMEIRSNSRLLASRPPKARDVSPARRTPRTLQMQPSEPFVEDYPSPTPFGPPRVQLSSKADNDLSLHRAGLRKAPTLPRKISSNSLTATESARTVHRLSETTPYVQYPRGESSTISLNDRDPELVAAAGSQATTDAHVVDLPMEAEPFSLSPQSATSTSTSVTNSITTRQDHLESVLSQPAQTNRKIMDLEIRNTSLMAVNNLLEKQTLKQATEMKDLRKRIVHMTKFPISNFSAGAADRDVCSDEDEEMEEEIDAEEDLQEVGERLLKASTNVDRTIKRALLLSEQLLEDARKGLHYRPRESEIGIGLRKVIRSRDDDENENVMEDEGQSSSMIVQEIEQLLNNDEDADVLNLELDSVLSTSNT